MPPNTGTKKATRTGTASTVSDDIVPPIESDAENNLPGTAPELYESHFTCHFFRLWGRYEGATGDAEPAFDDAVLMGNAQNFLDAAFGDVAGMVKNRYFLVEFKRRRKGIADEMASKEHRAALVELLDKDIACKALSLRGHFAGYPNAKLKLMFEPYYCAGKSPAIKNKVMNFLDFHHKLTKDDSPRAQALGWTSDDFYHYVACMYRHLEQGTDLDRNSAHSTRTATIKGRVMLGTYDPKTKKFIGFVDNFDSLIRALKDRLDAARKAQEKDATSTAKPGKTTKKP
ncbi:MAG TPA: hypothetical protein VF800_21700 [Telluria sp.]|jgi:hypothetical protein